jgi:excisionase family DNA binding protein
MNQNDILKHLECLVLAQKKVLNADEFCQYTGLSKSAMYKLTSAKKIPYSNPNGKLIYFNRDSVDAFLLSNPVTSQDDIEQAALSYLNTSNWKGGQI